MKVENFMTSDVMCVNINDKISKAAEIMKSYNIGAVPVESDSKLVGILTDRDIIIRGIASNKKLDEYSCGDLMTDNVYSVVKTDDIGKAVDYMSKHQVRRIPVTDEGKVVGIVSIGDLVDSEFSDELVGEVVSKISK